MIKHSTNRHSLRKKTFCLCLLALGAACLVTGCKKDKREKIDLSSTHTTAAETMAPETSQAETTQAETTASITLDAAVENAANANSTKPSDESGAASAVTSIKTAMETYTSGKISIQYPSISLDDSKKTASINELLKSNALSFIKANKVDEAKDTLAIQCRVLSADRSRISVTYTGLYTPDGAAYPTNVFFSSNIDVNKASNIRLSYFSDPATLAGYVLSDSCSFPLADAELKTALMKEKNTQTLDYYTKLFNNADFSSNGQFPASFSYDQDGDIYFSIPVSHALGDYAMIVFTPDTK